MGVVNNRIKERRLSRSMTLLQVADCLGVKEATVQRYESGEIKNIKHNTIVELAKLFGCSPQYLMGWSDDPYDYDSDPEQRMISIDKVKYEQLYKKHNGFIPKMWEEFWEDESNEFSKNLIFDLPGIMPIPRTVRKPLLGNIACGEPILAIENLDGYVDTPEDIHCDFALRCKGDSMVGARIHDGDVVYIRQQDDVEEHEIAAVIIDEEGATLKRVRREGHFLFLMAENPAYPTIIVNGEHTARIIGKAVGFFSIIK